MSYCDTELPSVYNAEDRRARKEHRCCECRAQICPGEIYVYCVGKWDGAFSAYKQHALCANLCETIRDQSDGECIGFGGLKDYWSETYWHDGEVKRRPKNALIRNMYAAILRRERRAVPR